MNKPERPLSEDERPWRGGRGTGERDPEETSPNLLLYAPVAWRGGMKRVLFLLTSHTRGDDR